MSPPPAGRVGLVPCPLCKAIPLRQKDCRACDGQGMVAVDRAIEIGLSTSDIERELPAVKEPR